MYSHNIPHRPGGPNEVLVRCPFCGENDPSQHMSISLRGRGWRCLRVQSHKGKSYARLLANMVGCGEAFARDLLGEAAQTLPSEDAFSETWRKQLGLEQTAVPVTKLEFPPEFKPLHGLHGRFAEIFWQYLRGRGYSGHEAEWLAKTYKLQYAISGYWAYRLIIPIFSSNGVLLTWTARAVTKDAEIRYLTLNSQQSVESAPNLLLGLDFLWKSPRPEYLVVCEGPFDAMAVTALGNQYGIWGTCLFGVQVSNAQSVILDDLSRKFEHVRLLVDPDARLKVLNFRDRLPKRCQVLYLDDSISDPGELPSHKEGAEYLKHIVA